MGASAGMAARHEWGYGDLAELCEEMGWNYTTATNYKSVCDAYDLSNRFDNLSFAHHLVAQGPDQRELLEWAVENKCYMLCGKRIRGACPFLRM